MLAPQTLIGRYVIKRKLAEGGMAEIFLASAEGPEGFSKDVAIKVVRSYLASDSQFIQMFIAEARLASRLNHANVVQIFDFGKHQDSYYLAMEYVHGASLWELRRRCRDQGVPFPPTLAAEIGTQVARGLQYAHNLSEGGRRIGVVHRDVTPHNVLLSFDGAVKLTDFGIAKAASSQTSTGMLKGKFAYMAPEQARGEKVDARTDIFALGIVLWELLTGGKLFDGDSDLAVLRAVQESLIAPPARLNPDVPAELSDVVMKALARAPAERFQSAFEMEKALATFVLRNAQSVDETALSPFLQRLFPEEFSPGEHGVHSGHSQTTADDFGTGDTHAHHRPTITATPRPSALGAGPAPTVHTDVQGPAQVPMVREGTELKPLHTEHMPQPRNSSRRLPPLPAPEPSIIVRPSAHVLPEVGANEPAHPTEVSRSESIQETPSVPIVLPKSNMPIIVVLGIIIIGLGTTLFVLTRHDEAPPTVVQKQPVAVLPEPVVQPTAKEPEAALAPPVVPTTPSAEALKKEDAGKDALVTAVAPPPPAPAPTLPKPAPPAERSTEKASPPAKKYGTLEVKAVPYATVTIQGKSYEITGVQRVPAPVGSYDITLTHPKKQQRESVVIKANQTFSVSFSAN